MATQITLTINRNRKNMEKVRAELMLEGPSRKKIFGLRKKISGLCSQVLDSDIPGSRITALGRIIRLADGFRSKMNGKKEEEIIQCFDACHFALETIAQQSEDPEIRARAFDYIKHNSVAVKLTCELARHEDIRKKARAQLPSKPDQYYSWIGPDLEKK